MKRKLIYTLIIILLFTNIAYGDNSQVRIALIDTGIASDVIDPQNIIPGFNYITQTKNTEDKVGHGTALAGIIVGARDLHIKGLDPKVKLVPLVIASKTAENKYIMAEPDVLAQAIVDAIDIYNCKIINVSAGTTLSTKALKESIAYAEEKGVAVISAVGNDNKHFPDNIYYPAAYDTVIGVSALKKNGQVASFSQRNSSVSICAPGDRLRLASIDKGKTTFGFGTSYASSYVSGAVALLVSEKPNLKPEEIRKRLFETAHDLEEKGYDQNSGWGEINLD